MTALAVTLPEARDTQSTAQPDGVLGRTWSVTVPAHSQAAARHGKGCAWKSPREGLLSGLQAPHVGPE